MQYLTACIRGVQGEGSERQKTRGRRGKYETVIVDKMLKRYLFLKNMLKVISLSLETFFEQSDIVVTKLIKSRNHL